MVHELVLATLQRHVIHRTSPDDAEREHLVAFCIHGVRR
jgi:hypothetical protein